MKLVQIEDDGVSILYHAPEEDRWYVGHNESPGHWWYGTSDKDGALRCMQNTLDFWEEKVTIKDEPTVARIDGRHYQIGDEDSTRPSCMRGFSGRRFTIEFSDGRIVDTSNLWTQGTIPTAFRDRLPNNAVFKEQ